MELRHILFSLIEHIEVYLIAVITNYFSLKYGNFGYKDISNYKKKFLGEYFKGIRKINKQK